MNPLKKHLAILRNRETPMVEFKKSAHALAKHIAQEVKQEIQAEEIVLVPILRAGMALLPPFMETFPKARVAFIGIHRDENAQPHLYYEKFPPFSENDHFIILDPMIATGGSTLLTLKKLLSLGAHPSRISIVSMIGAPEGKEAILAPYPKIHLHIAILDTKLDAKKYIVPGLGDFGDRFFGTL
ncbi:MAG: uracil phosphoribosyltransferase [Chlamydiales bacterium]|nr:uracil phosphoribosyltransferase [Chlamydiales bacterium]